MYLSTFAWRLPWRLLSAKRCHGTAPTVIEALQKHAVERPHKTAIITLGGSGEEVDRRSYGELYAEASSLASHLVKTAAVDGCDGLEEARIAFLCRPGHRYAVVQSAIWLAGGVAVPLCASHPAPELAYVISDSGARLVLTDVVPGDCRVPEAAAEKEDEEEDEVGSIPVITAAAECGVAVEIVNRAKPCPTPLTPTASKGRELPAPESKCMIIYTSGTTGPPKGAVLLHSTLAAQVQTMVEPWGWQSTDRLLHMLPLHHLHGVLNWSVYVDVIACAFFSLSRMLCVHYARALSRSLSLSPPPLSLSCTHTCATLYFLHAC